MKHRHTNLAAAVVALLALLCAADGRANDTASYPSQNIKIIVPFPAGGTADTCSGSCRS